MGRGWAPATVAQVVAATMAALGVYERESTPGEHAEEDARSPVPLGRLSHVRAQTVPSAASSSARRSGGGMVVEGMVGVVAVGKVVGVDGRGHQPRDGVDEGVFGGDGRCSASASNTPKACWSGRARRRPR